MSAHPAGNKITRNADGALFGLIPDKAPNIVSTASLTPNIDYSTYQNQFTFTAGSGNMAVTFPSFAGNLVSEGQLLRVDIKTPASTTASIAYGSDTKILQGTTTRVSGTGITVGASSVVYVVFKYVGNQQGINVWKIVESSITGLSFA
jgi:hypothetical protein